MGIITAYHVEDARKEGELGLVPWIALAVVVVVAAGTALYLTQGRSVDAREHSARLFRWAVPLALCVAALRVVLMVLDR